MAFYNYHKYLSQSLLLKASHPSDEPRLGQG